jgi:RNA-directed DNA polymerase
LREEVAAALAPMGLRLSEEKTRIAHIDEGFDFLGWRIQRHKKRGTTKRYIYTYPAKKALLAVCAKIRALTRGSTNQPLAVLLDRINPILRGWTSYFKHGASKATFAYLGAFTWHRVLIWLRHKHKRVSWKWLRGRYLPGWRPTDGKAALLNPAAVTVSRYRYRGQRIPSPWSQQHRDNHQPIGMGLGRAGCPANGHVRFGRAGWEDDRLARAAPRPSLTLTGAGGPWTARRHS